MIRCALKEDIALDMQIGICNADAIYLNRLDYASQKGRKWCPEDIRCAISIKNHFVRPPIHDCFDA